MSRPHLLDALRDRVLLCDGGMGSRETAVARRMAACERGSMVKRQVARMRFSRRNVVVSASSVVPNRRTIINWPASWCGVMVNWSS